MNTFFTIKIVVTSVTLAIFAAVCVIASSASDFERTPARSEALTKIGEEFGTGLKVYTFKHNGQRCYVAHDKGVGVALDCGRN